MSTSKTGKHGHAKVHLVAIDIFTNKKLEDLSPSTHNMDVPVVKRDEYQLVNIDDGFLNLMSQDGNAKDDVKLPESEVGEQIQQFFEDGKDVRITSLSSHILLTIVAFRRTSGDCHHCLCYGRRARSWCQGGSSRRELCGDRLAAPRGLLTTTF